MAIYDLKANLDLKQNMNVYATCKQLDNLNLILSIYDNSVQVDLSSYTVRLKAMKADKVPLVQHGTGISISNNVVTIECDEQLTTTSGKTLIELQFIDNSTAKKKATFNLVLIVIASTLADGATISKSTYTLLEELENKMDQASNFFENIDEAITANNNLQDSISTGNTLKTNLDNNITTGNTLNNDLETNISAGNILKPGLEGAVTSANTAKAELDISIQDANTFVSEHGDIIDLDNRVTQNTSQLNEIAKLNLLINGGFLINQRGALQYNTNYRYTVDRWLLSNMNSDEHTVSGVLNVGDGYVELTGMGDKQLMITQSSTDNTTYLQNKTITFSIEARVENMTQGDIFVQISAKTTSNFVVKRSFNNTEVGNEWTKISVTANLPNTKLDQFWFQCGSFNDTAGGYHPINSDCKIQFRNAKVEVGDKATPFIPRLYGEELSLCQRYYETGYIWGNYMGSIPYQSYHCPFKIDKRSIPTVTYKDPNVSGTTVSVQTDAINQDGLNCIVSSSVGTSGTAYRFQVAYYAEAELY